MPCGDKPCWASPGEKCGSLPGRGGARPLLLGLELDQFFQQAFDPTKAAVDDPHQEQKSQNADQAQQAGNDVDGAGKGFEVHSVSPGVFIPGVDFTLDARTDFRQLTCI